MNRPYTSMSVVKDLRLPERRTAMKVLVKKTYGFVDRLWAEYVEHNRADLRYITVYKSVYMHVYTYSLRLCTVLEVGVESFHNPKDDQGKFIIL